jgi:hypothetical protein
MSGRGDLDDVKYLVIKILYVKLVDKDRRFRQGSFVMRGVRTGALVMDWIPTRREKRTGNGSAKSRASS